ncbi:MAG: hypothetical protein ACK4S4_06315 [Pyrinomonadaceae bacterium]
MPEIERLRTTIREEGLYKIVTLEWEENGFPCFCDLRVSAELQFDELDLDEVTAERLQQLLSFVSPDTFDEFIDADTDSLL